MSTPDDQDNTPIVGSAPDIAPLGRSGEKPAHEKTASEDGNGHDWSAIAADPAFIALKRAKLRFIIPGTIFFLAYYMALPILVGYFPDAMKTPVLGKVNWAYLFAVSQFFMTWIMCALYVRAARRWDIMNAALLSKLPRH
jgi:uncharacterized membrane protein (DUF485 family)